MDILYSGHIVGDAGQDSQSRREQQDQANYIIIIISLSVESPLNALKCNP